MTHIRITEPRLAIDRGRYTTPITTLEERTCTMCQSQDTEEEAHFLLHCGQYNMTRNKQTNE